MKIAHLITSMSHGGAERQLLELCVRMVDSGHSVCVGSMQSGGSMAAEFRSCGIPLAEMGMSNALDVSSLVRVTRWLKEQSPELLHTHLFKADLYGAIAARRLRIPFVFTVWNDDPYLKRRAIRWVIRRLARSSGRVVSLSHALKKRLVEDVGIEESRVLVIPLGIARERIGFRSGTQGAHRFGIVGRLVEQKGHAVALEAFRSVPEPAELHIVGAGPLESGLKAMVDRLRITGRVFFHGLIPDPDRIYDCFDILLMPSLWEGAGLVLLEAMARGIPIIASAVGGIPETTGPDCAILVEPADAAALRNAMNRMMTDSQFRQQLSALGPARAGKHDFGSVLQAYLSVYRQAAGGAA